MIENEWKLKWIKRTRRWISSAIYNWAVPAHFEPWKSYKKNLQNSRRFLNYIKYSCIIFCAKMFGYSQIIYCLQKESRTNNFEINQVFICPKMFQYSQIIYCWHVEKVFSNKLYGSAIIIDWQTLMHQHTY